MPEGDTIRYAVSRMRPVLEGRVPDEIVTPQPRHAMDRWPERLAGRAIRAIDAHGKHLFLRFEGGLTLHSHLRMTGAWAVHERGNRWRRSPRRAWLVLRTARHEVVEFDGPVLELMTDSRTRFDQRLHALGPDVLAESGFDAQSFLRRLREDDPRRGIGDALLDQRTVAGIGNVWKAEACWAAGVDPWRPVGGVCDATALAIIGEARPRMQESARTGRHPHHERNGRPCPRCGEAIRARGQGDGNRMTFWCPECQR
ncbi:MAG: DNA-formamidopyrimidine glycosylase family protein [Solirubrobacteraceae bacterium]